MYRIFTTLLIFISVTMPSWAVNEPIIITQPTTQNICWGANTAVNASASNADYYYLERQNGTSWELVYSNTYQGEMLSLAFNNVNSTNTYRVKFTNSAGINSAYTNNFTISAHIPSISQQPSDQNNCSGLTAKFDISATGSGTLIYQWQIKKPTDVDFSNISTASLTNIGNTTNPHLSQYRCIVTDGFGCSITSNAATLTVNKVLSANDPTLCSGLTANLTITLQGNPVSYQWQKKTAGTSSWPPITDNALYSGTTTKTLTMSNVPITENNADYRCRVTFSVGSTNSTCVYSPALVAEQNRLTILSSPQKPSTISAERCGAGNITLSASGASTGQNYRWYADTTQTTLQNTGATFSTNLSANTTYFVGIYDASCESYRQSVSATIHEVPSISLGAITAICPSENSFLLPFSVISGSPNKISISSTMPNFTAWLDSTLVNSPLKISLPTTKTSSNYNFDIYVKNSVTNCISNNYIINLPVKSLTKITQQPILQGVCEGSEASFSVSATGEGTMSYQWRKDGINILNETNASLTIANAQTSDVGVYDCIVRSECDSVISAGAVLSLTLQVATQPTNQTICEGKEVTFSTLAAGTGTFNYKWKKNGNNIGTNSPNLTLSDVALTDNNALIECEISSACGSVMTQAVTLFVNAKPLPPTVVSPTGFCQNTTNAILSATATNSNSLLWYGSNATGGTAATTPTSVPTNIAGDYFYYVSQKDANLCESNRAEIKVNITPSLSANLGYSPDRICATGLLNKVSTLTVSPNGGNSVYSYEWSRDGIVLSGENSSTYQASSAGLYSVKVKSGYCETSKSATISAILSELNIIPTANDVNVCGSTASLSASTLFSGGNFRWYDAANTTTLFSTQNPLTISGLTNSFTFYVAYSKTDNLLTCESPRKAVVVNVKSIPNPPTINGTASICLGDSAILSGSNCTGTILWSNGMSGTNIKVSPTATMAYTAKCQSNICLSADSEPFVVSIKAKPSITISPITAACNNATNFEIAYSNAQNSPITYSLSSSMPDFVAVNNAAFSSSPITVNIPNGKVGIHTFNLTLKGECENIQNFTMEVLQSVSGGSIKASPTNTYCAGYNPATLTSETDASKGKSPYQYQWESSSDGINFTNISGANATSYDPPALNDTTYYRRKVSDACGEVAYSNTHRINVVPDPIIMASASKTVVCSGESFTLTQSIVESGTGTCVSTWQSSNTASMSSIVSEGTGNTLKISYVNAGTTILKKYLRAKYDCSASTCNLAYSNVIEMDIYPIPSTPSISGANKICTGSSTILKASNCTNGTVKWNNNIEADSIIVSSAGTYWAVCKNVACESAKSNEIVVEVSGVLAPPTITGTASICLGDSALLTASNCTGTILWSNGMSGTSIKVSPTATMAYTAKCQSEICLSVDSEPFVVNIKEKPSITISPITAACNNATNFEMAYSNVQNSPTTYSLSSSMPDFVAVNNAAFSSSPITINIPSGKVGIHTFTLSLKGDCENAQTFTMEVLQSVSGGSIKASPTSTYCAGYNPATLTSEADANKGKSPYQYQWESSSDGINFTNISGANATSYDPPALNDTTYYRRKVSDACGEVAYSNIHQINVVPDPIITASASKTVVCSGESFTLTQNIVEAGTGTCASTWQSSNSSSMSSVITEGTGNSLNISNVNAGTTILKKYLRAKYDCSASTCNLAYSNVIEMDIYPIPSTPSISGANKICTGSSTILRASNCTNGTVKWNNNIEVDSIIVSSAGTYWAVCKNVACESAKSNEIVVEVSGVLAPPTIIGTASICLGDSALLTANNCTGTILWSNGMSGTSIKVSPTATTIYTAKCQSNICLSADSEPFVVSIKAKPSITISSITAACNNATSFEIVYSNTQNSPTAYSLSSSMPDFVAVNNAAFSSSPITINIPIGKAGIHTFNLTLKDECESTQTFTLEVLQSVIGGSIKASPTSTYCAGYNPATLTSETDASKGKSPYQYQWESSSDGINFTNISGANATSYDPPALNDTTYYRRKVSDACGEVAYSNIHQINVVPDPIITASASKTVVCSGESFTLTQNIVEAGTGTCATTWQSSNSSSMTSPTTEGTGNTLNMSYVNAGTTILKKYLRAKYDCSASTCNLVYSNVIEMDIYPIPSTPSISGANKICTGSSTILRASNCTNGTVKWNNNIEADSIIVSSAGTYWAVCKNLACESAKSNESVVEVSGVLAPPTITGTASICLGDSAILIANNCTGTILWSNGMSGTSIKVSPTATTTYTAKCQSNICLSVASNEIIVSVTPLPTITTQPKNEADCKGNSAYFEVKGTNITSVQWQIYEGSSFVDIAGASNSKLSISSVGTSPFLDATQYKAKLSNGSCSIYSNLVTLHVNSIAGSISDQTVCENADSVAFDLNNLQVIGQIQSLQWQKKNGSTWLDLNRKTSNELIIKPLSLADAGIYRCKITFHAGTSTCVRYTTEDDANGALLNITSTEKPIITGSNLLCLGKSTTLSASGCGGGTLSWSNGGLGASISVNPNVSSNYTVTCTSALCGISVVSDTFHLAVQETAMPTNNTPSSVILPTNLTFSAIGINLKWYATATTSTYTTIAPQFNTIGVHKYWVSQTINGCESPRLLIQSQVFTPLFITQQAQNQYDCKGNGVTISLTATGIGTITYQWQRKLPNESTFTNLMAGNGISNEQTHSLKISGVGNEFNPNLSQYRCIVQDSLNTITSDIVTLYVNSVVGSLPNQGVCKGKNFSVNLLTYFQVTGEVDAYQWQSRTGTSGAWSDLVNNNRISGANSNQLIINNVVDSDGIYYRCSVKFKTGGFTCIESSDAMKLTVGNYPNTPNVTSPIEYCQLEKAIKLGATVSNKNNDLIWYSTDVPEGTIDRPLPSTLVAKNLIYFVSERTPEGCESGKSMIEVIVHPQPDAPINTTPEIVEQGTLLTFSASGTNLKWFSSKTGRTFTSQAPSFSVAGTYIRYVSQTSAFGCESARTMITATIIPVLSISKQPVSQADCNGNSVSFSLTAKSSSTIFYQWQMKLPEDSTFVNIVGANDKSLIIKDIGSVPAPNGTQFRCILKDDKSTLSSEIATLTVNEIKGNITDLAVCKGKNASLSLKNLSITGEVKYFEWQKYTNKTWISFDTTNTPATNLGKADSSITGKYRAKIVFKTDAKNTCNRYTNEINAILYEVPKPLITNDLSICQSDSAKLLANLQGNENYQLLWYKNPNDNSFQSSKAILSQAGTFQYFVSQKSPEGCESEAKLLTINIKANPQKPFADTLLHFCQYSQNIELSAASSHRLIWYENDNKINGSSPSLDMSVASKNTYFVSAIDSNACESEKLKIKVNVEPCFMQEPYECQTLSLDNVRGNDWFYFIDNQANVYAAINPNGNKLGKVSLQTKHYGLGEENIPQTTFKTALMSRYFNFESSLLNRFDKPVNIKLFFTFKEFDDYKKAIQQENLEFTDLNLLHYDGVFEDCGFENNNNVEGESMVIYKNIVADSVNQNSFSLQFSVNSFSEIGASTNDFTILQNFKAEKEAETVHISWFIKEMLKPNKFEVQRSLDQKNWIKVGEIAALNSQKGYEMLDYLPNSGKNYYRLVYIDQDNTKKYLDPVSLVFSDEKQLCRVFPNPVQSEKSIQLYLRNINSPSFELYTLLGQSISIDIKKDALGLYQIQPKVALSQGIYYLISLDKDGKRCVQRVLVE